MTVSEKLSRKLSLYRKTVSVLVCLSMVFASLSFLPVTAGGAGVKPEEIEKEPERIMRLTDAEPNLYTKIWLNADGTRTLEYFGEPVKYTDNEGNVKDKLLTFKEERKGFSAEQIDITYFFDKNLGNGIALSYGETEIFMFPAGVDCEGELSDDKETLTYRFDSSAVYEYSLTYSGYKENIIVSEYTGRTEYKFVYLTNGAKIKQSDGDTFISDEKGNAIATFSDIIIFTADEKNNTLGEITVEELKENENSRCNKSTNSLLTICKL